MARGPTAGSTTLVSGLHSALAAPFTGKTRVQSCDVPQVLSTVRLVWRVTWFPPLVGDFIPPVLFLPFSGFRVFSFVCPVVCRSVDSGSRGFEGPVCHHFPCLSLRLCL